MNPFVQRLGSSVIGQLNGFDRMRFRGTLRLLSHVGGMMHYLSTVRVKLTQFADHVEEVTRRMTEAVRDRVLSLNRPYVYMQRPSDDKEAMALRIADRDRITSGLIAVLYSVEPCWSYDIHRNREHRQIELQRTMRKCIHWYWYWQHEEYGLMHVRVQSWFPLTMHVLINGRSWLERQMQASGMSYQKRENCFVWVSDVQQAQALLDSQLKTDWPKMLGGLAHQANPAWPGVLGACPVDYYWSLEQSEWASDVMFKDAASLSQVYPSLVRQAIQTLQAQDVMRFLGRKVKDQVHGSFRGQVISSLQHRPEGVRIRHSVNGNTVKMYDKQGSVLRVETAVYQPRDMKVYRAKEGDEDGEKSWRPLRKGVADLHRRAKLSQQSNDRYMEALASMDPSTPLKEVSAPLCRRKHWRGQPARGLNPLREDDAELLEAVSRGEYVINGLRNRDIRQLLHGPGKDSHRIRQQSSAITRQIRLLRAHGLIRKLPHTHRYRVTKAGRCKITALLAAREADTAQLLAAA